MDPTKFISGVLCSLSAMVQLELPHINVLTKCDLVDDKELSKYGTFALALFSAGSRNPTLIISWWMLSLGIWIRQQGICWRTSPTRRMPSGGR